MYYNNPYPNGGFYPYGYSQPVQRQPQYGTPVPQPVQEPPVREVKFVTSEEAKACIVMPNSASLLIDKQQGVAYLKYADGMGQSFIECFKYSRNDSQPKPTEISYVTQDAFDTLAARVDGICKKLEETPTEEV